MKTAQEVLNRNIPFIEILPLANNEQILVAMKEYAEQALSIYRSKILHLPSEQRDNDFFIMGIEIDECLI